MSKLLEKGICILIGICISMLILSFRYVYKVNTKENISKRNVEYILTDLETVLKGDSKFIDERIKEYAKTHKKENINEDKIKKLLGEFYNDLKERAIEKISLNLIFDDINKIYIVTYTLKIDEELTELNIEVKLDENNKIKDMRFIDYICVSK